MVDPAKVERSKANELAQMWAASERTHQERRHRENRAAWYAHFCALAESMRRWAEEYDEQAEALLEE